MASSHSKASYIHFIILPEIDKLSCLNFFRSHISTYKAECFLQKPLIMFTEGYEILYFDICKPKYVANSKLKHYFREKINLLSNYENKSEFRELLVKYFETP